MASKDLLGVRFVEEFCRRGIDSMKIEGRMKSALYLATTCRAYRNLIDRACEGELTEEDIEVAERELNALPHRSYCDGSLEEPAGAESIYDIDCGGVSNRQSQFVGMVLDANQEWLALRLQAPLEQGMKVQFLPFRGEPLEVEASSLFTVQGYELSSVRQESVVCLKRQGALEKVQPYNIARVSP